MKRSLGVQACIDILKWLRPRVIGGLVCLLIFFSWPIFVIQSFFVSEHKDLWLSKIFRWVEGKDGEGLYRDDE